jgi:uncharacterized membrane protein YtjA (UPF0391 family)
MAAAVLITSFQKGSALVGAAGHSHASPQGEHPRRLNVSLPETENGRPPMLHWALTFLVLGLIAALFGFTGIAGASIGIAKILFFVFLAIFAVVLLMGATRGRGTL